MNAFVTWRRAKGFNANPKFPESKSQLGNYRNFVYQGNKPLCLGINCMQGLRIFNPFANAASKPPVAGDSKKSRGHQCPFFHLMHSKPTPHGIRRGGGGSGHFKLLGSFDRAVEHGRWVSVGSARMYINEVAAKESALGSCEQGKRRFENAVQNLPRAFASGFFLVIKFSMHEAC